MGLMGLVMMVAPAIGPALSGLVIEKLSWNWIFCVTLPFLALALLAGIYYMQNVTTLTKPKIDILSIGLSTIGFGGIVQLWLSVEPRDIGSGGPVLILGCRSLA